MPSPHDPHDPRFELDRQDNLALLALGEQVDPVFAAHQSQCPRCQHELRELDATVRLARGSARDIIDSEPPARLWDAIAAEVAGLPAPVSARRPRRWQYGLIAAALVLAGVAGGFVVGRQGSRPGTSVLASAKLVQQPGGPADVSGTASVTRSDKGVSIRVNTDRLPLRTGYYAVWVYDPAIDHMINIGALNSSGSGSFSLPPGVDIHEYDIVDVSAQNFDGNPAHQQSVLQGGLTQ